MTTRYKIQAANCFKRFDNDIYYSVSFDDGITIIYKIVDKDLIYDGMLSVGLSSSFLLTGKWPNKQSINTRSKHSKKWFVKNINRYKFFKK